MSTKQPAVSAKYDLRTDEGLQAACAEIQKQNRDSSWHERLQSFLSWVDSADETQRASEDFQRRIWEEDTVSSVGSGNVRVEGAIQDSDFRAWLAKASLESLPQDPEQRLAKLRALRDEIFARLAPLCTRVPRLKTYRVLAAFYPRDFSTVSYRGAIRRLRRGTIGRGSHDPVDNHAAVLGRLAEVLGPTGEGWEAIVERMTLPWRLFRTFVKPAKNSSGSDDSDDPEDLIPLPAARRRRGLTGVRGMFSGMLEALKFLRGGASRAEFIDFLRVGSPRAKDSSLGMTINVLQSEFGVIGREGDEYKLTERGESVLDRPDHTMSQRHIKDVAWPPGILGNQKMIRGTMEALF